MYYTGRNQAVIELPDIRARPDMPGPFRVTIRGFSRYAETVPSLPLLERVKLSIAADFVSDSYLPGNYPILRITLIGHADTDPDRERREPGSVKRISENRAAEVERALKEEIRVRNWIFRFTTLKPSPFEIIWRSTGVGSTQPDQENVRRKKTHATMTEADRKLNRRVEILLEPGPTRIPDPNRKDPGEAFWEMMRKWSEYIRTKHRHRLPIPRFPNPMPRDEYIKFKCMILDSLKNFDIDTALSTLKDAVIKEPDDPYWTNSLKMAIDEIAKRKNDMEKEWWVDADCGAPPPPAPPKTVRLTVEPRTVVVKQGGMTKFKVVAHNRTPDANKPRVEVRLENLPPGVTMAGVPRFIPPYRDDAEVAVEAAANAPLRTETAVFASGKIYEKGGYGGLTVTSDIFTVVVQAP